MKYFNYLKYVLKHKYYVYLAGTKIGCSRWQLLIHDMSKFRASEFFPYVEYFYGNRYVYANLSTAQKTLPFDVFSGSIEYAKKMFELAWLKHQARNEHHWQHWILHNDNGSIEILKMPRKYILEMVADWAGAGRAIKGEWDILEWWKSKSDGILLHPDTRKEVEVLVYKMHIIFNT